jgi:hypothetical protein
MRSNPQLTWEPLTAFDPGGTGEAQEGEMRQVVPGQAIDWGRRQGQNQWMFLFAKAATVRKSEGLVKD